MVVVGTGAGVAVSSFLGSSILGSSFLGSSTFGSTAGVGAGVAAGAGSATFGASAGMGAAGVAILMLDDFLR